MLSTTQLTLPTLQKIAHNFSDVPYGGQEKESYIRHIECATFFLKAALGACHSGLVKAEDFELPERQTDMSPVLARFRNQPSSFQRLFNGMSLTSEQLRAQLFSRRERYLIDAKIRPIFEKHGLFQVVPLKLLPRDLQHLRA